MLMHSRLIVDLVCVTLMWLPSLQIVLPPYTTKPDCCFKWSLCTRCCKASLYFLEAFLNADRKSSTCVHESLKSRWSMQVVETLFQLWLHKTSCLKHFLAVLVPRTSSISRPVDRTSSNKHLTWLLPRRRIFCEASATATVSWCRLTGGTLTGHRTHCNPSRFEMLLRVSWRKASRDPAGASVLM